MNQLLDAANRYLKACDWRDIALLKVCVCALGVLVGLAMPWSKKWAVAWGGVAGVCGHLCASDGEIPSLPFGGASGDQRYL